MERKKRRQPKTVDKKPINPTPVQEQILELLEDYPYLTASLLAQFFGKNYTSYISPLIGKLAASGLVHYYEHDPPLPLNWPDPVSLNRQSKQLSKLGFERPPASSFFVHDFQVCRYTASLHAEANRLNIPFTIKPYIWPKQIDLPSSISHTFPDGTTKSSNKSTRPDDLFRIYNSNYAIELERGNPKRPTFDLNRASPLRKILCYAHIAKTKQYEKLGLTNLRVIFIASNKEAMLHMRDLALDLCGPTNLFLFNYMDYSKGTPVPHLLHADYERAGLPPKKLYKDLTI